MRTWCPLRPDPADALPGRPLLAPSLGGPLIPPQSTPMSEPALAAALSSEISEQKIAGAEVVADASDEIELCVDEELPAASASSVVLKGEGSALTVELDAEAAFERLRDDARRVFGADPDRFRGGMARLDLGARTPDLFDLRRLAHLLRDDFGVQVTGLYCTPEALHRYAEAELKLKVHLREPAAEEPEEVADEATEAPEAQPVAVVEEIVATPHAEDHAHGRRVLTLDRTVRSGSTVRFAGDILIFGDVNAGAQILAGGSILVLGALRGLAHAGMDGDERAVVLGFDLRPTQIRIGRKIAISPDRPEQRGPRHYTPEIAWVCEDRIVIEDYRGRLPS